MQRSPVNAGMTGVLRADSLFRTRPFVADLRSVLVTLTLGTVYPPFDARLCRGVFVCKENTDGWTT